jgi:hypothetical protein
VSLRAARTALRRMRSTSPRLSLAAINRIVCVVRGGRLPAALLALGLLAACTCNTPKASDVDLLHREIDYLGAMAAWNGTRTPAQLRGITASVTSAHRRLESAIAGAGS